MKVEDTKLPNFLLKGFNSIQIGIYFLISAYLIKSMIVGFLVDDTAMMLMSVQLIEFFIIGVLCVLFLFSSLALFYSNRRSSRKQKVKIWNPGSKKRCWIYLTHFIIGLSILILFYSNGLYNYIVPAGLVIYTILLITLSNSDKAFYLLAFIGLLLAITSFVIPSYWYSSILLLGVAHFVYGVINSVKK